RTDFPYNDFGDVKQTDFFVGNSSSARRHIVTFNAHIDNLGRVTDQRVADKGGAGSPSATTTKYDADGNIIQTIRYDVTGQTADWCLSAANKLSTLLASKRRITSTRFV